MYHYAFRSVPKADYIRKTLGGLFTIPNETRWNSLYDAIVRVRDYLLAQEDNLSSVFAHIGVAPITANERVWMAEFVQVMGPVAAALDVLQGEKTTSAGKSDQKRRPHYKSANQQLLANQ